MRKSRKHVLPVFALLVASAPVFSQTASQLSNGLCAEIESNALENGRLFEVFKPPVGSRLTGGCRASADGYFLSVTNSERILHLALGFNVGLLSADASAFWLRLSAFDNLTHAALGTKPKSVFDGLGKLAKALALKAVKEELRPDTLFSGKADRAFLVATGGSDNDKIVLLGAYADVSDIDEMKRGGEQDSPLPPVSFPPVRESKASDGVPTWRRILALSLQVLGAGAQGYANAYRGPNAPQWQSQPLYSAPKTCYTNFIGNTAFTNCY